MKKCILICAISLCSAVTVKNTFCDVPASIAAIEEDVQEGVSQLEQLAAHAEAQGKELIKKRNILERHTYISMLGAWIVGCVMGAAMNGSASNG
ncbi:MAG: hypothetical protein WA432_05145 [Candidatus Babeliaceae bacterium]